MNKARLSTRMPARRSMPSPSADNAVTAVISTIDDVFSGGETDRITDFETFSIRSRPARQGRNPRAWARASPSTPRRRLPSHPARSSARSPTSGLGEREFVCRTAPMRRGMNGRGKSAGSASALPVRCRSAGNTVGRPIRTRRNQIARAFVAKVAKRRRRDFCDPLRVRTQTQSRQQREAPVCPLLSMARCKSSAATALRLYALKLKRKDCLAADCSRLTRTEVTRPRADEVVPSTINGPAPRKCNVRGLNPQLHSRYLIEEERS